MAICQAVETYSRTAKKSVRIRPFERKGYKFIKKYIIENGIKRELVNFLRNTRIQLHKVISIR